MLCADDDFLSLFGAPAFPALLTGGVGCVGAGCVGVGGGALQPVISGGRFARTHCSPSPTPSHPSTIPSAPVVVVGGGNSDFRSRKCSFIPRQPCSQKSVEGCRWGGRGRRKRTGVKVNLSRVLRLVNGFLPQECAVPVAIKSVSVR